jgi:hypothetical protein
MEIQSQYNDKGLKDSKWIAYSLLFLGYYAFIFSILSVIIGIFSLYLPINGILIILGAIIILVLSGFLILKENIYLYQVKNKDKTLLMIKQRILSETTKLDELASIIFDHNYNKGMVEFIFRTDIWYLPYKIRISWILLKDFLDITKGQYRISKDKESVKIIFDNKERIYHYSIDDIQFLHKLMSEQKNKFFALVSQMLKDQDIYIQFYEDFHFPPQKIQDS